LLVLLPVELNLSADQQQRLIGGLVQAIMSNVAPEERKGYFLHPQTVLTMQRLVEQILQADGVTPEMIQAQEERLGLLSDMLRASDDAARLANLIEEHRAQIDYAFFTTLAAAAQEAEIGGDGSSAEQLLTLREQLLQDPELVTRLPAPLPPDATLETALEKLLWMLDDEQALAAMVGLNRPAFDYLFFQALTAQLEQARSRGDPARAERLRLLRERLLAEVEQQDRALQAAQQQDLQLIEELLGNLALKGAVRKHLARIDTLFLSTLGAAIQAARRQGNIQRSGHLDGLRQEILTLLAEAMPPELRLINRLLSLEKPEERQAVLTESAALLNHDLLALIEGLLEEVEAQGPGSTAGRLKAIQEEIQRARATDAAPGTPG